MEIFKFAIDDILKESYLRHGELKRACKAAVDLMAKHSTLQTSVASTGEDGGFDFSDETGFWKPFYLAYKTKVSRIIVVALNGLQKLMAHRIILGRQAIICNKLIIKSDGEKETKKIVLRLVDEIVEVICCCFSTSSSNEEVELQIMKVLLTIITNEPSEVHDTSLLRAVQTIFNIYIYTKSSMNRITAKATLIQIVNVVFQRMESFKSSEKLNRELGSDKQAIPPNDMKDHVDVNGIKRFTCEIIDQIIDDVTGLKLTDSNVDSKSIIQERTLNSEEVCRELVESVVHLAVKTLKETRLGCNKHERPDNLSDDTTDEQTSLHLSETEGFRNPSDFVKGLASRSLSIDSGKSVIGYTQITDNYSDLSRSQKKFDLLYSSDSPYYHDTLKRDVFLLFRRLCKLTAYNSAEGSAMSTDVKMLEIRSCELAMELIISALSNSGTIFRSHDVFVELLKHNLCTSLYQTGISSIDSICELSLSIFLILISLYKAPLKAEIETFFREVIIKILENPGSTSGQKSTTLNVVLSKMCNSPQLLVDIFVNYDCELGMDNIYETIVLELSNILQISNRPTQNDGLTYDVRLQEKALECLLSVVESLLKWSNLTVEESDEIIKDVIPEMIQPVNSTYIPVVLGDRVSLRSLFESFSVPKSISATITQEDLPQETENVRARKQTLKQALNLFNSDPIKGLQFLKDNRFVKDRVDNIVLFLKFTPNLEKAAIGELLGYPGPEYQCILHEFVDSMNFSGDNLLQALRKFLSTFRLPGESQKIDRIMEKFADRYCDNNPEIFSNADTAYTLSFSIIMLNTDLHSPRIKNKLTKPQYLKMNRDIGQNNELPDELLISIYDDIALNPIVLEPSNDDSHTSVDQRAIIDVFYDRRRLEGLSLMSDVHGPINEMEIFSRGQKRIGLFKQATHSDYVKPMFAVSWNAILASFSDAFDIFDDEKCLLCLKGFAGAIKISSNFLMETELGAFIFSLVRLTHLDDPSSIRQKHFNALKYLLMMAIENGNAISHSWAYILRCVSIADQIRHLRLGGPRETAIIILSTSSSSNRSAPVNSESDRSSKTEYSTSTMTKPSNIHASVSQTSINSRQVVISGSIVKQFSEQGLVIAIDNIFVQSILLDAKSIIDFIQALCMVSLEEIEAPRPRMFCLQRIVEISYYNLSRIRLEWGSIWRVLSPYFNRVGCNSNPEIAGFAVDSLKQLAMKFLEKAELAHFHTQNEFLKPFEYIIANNDSQEIRELVVQSLLNIVMSRASNIRSGWRSIFVTLTKLARLDQDFRFIKTSLEIIQAIIDQNFVSIHNNLVDLVSTVVEYLCLSGSETELNRDALKCLQSISAKLLEMDATGQINNDTETIDSESEQANGTLTNCALSEELFFLRWFPLLSGYSRIIADSRSISSRARSIDLLFSLLKTHAEKFSASLWKIILRTILLPIFEDLSHPQLRRTDSSSVVWIQALRQFVDLYTSLKPILPDLDFLKEILRINIVFIEQTNENLAQTGAICFHQLIWKNATVFQTQDWIEVATALEYVFDVITPKELFVPFEKDLSSHVQEGLVESDATEGRSADDQPVQSSRHIDMKAAKEIDFSHAIVKCAMQLIIIQSVKEISLTDQESSFDLMPRECRMRWLECLRKSYTFARDFNANYTLRLQLWKGGFVPQMPNLIKQETSSAATYISLLFRLYRSEIDSDKWVKRTMFDLILEVTQRYTCMLRDSEKYRKELITWAPMIVIILDELVNLNWESDKDFLVQVQQVFQLSLHLMNAEDPNIRASLQKFLGKIGTLFLRQEETTLNFLS